MKEKSTQIFLATLFFFFFSNLHYSQKTPPTISPSEAINYVGQNVVVKGFVAQVSKSKSGNIFINFDKKYPNNTFVAVIFKKNSYRFSNVQKYEGSQVQVRGFVTTYRGKAQIILEEQDQITLVKEKTLVY
jgi:DNA/RNA endonuclease YhcR with UshA esterase domain